MDNYEQAPEERKVLIERLLIGSVDLHCHSGPSVMPRSIDHIEAEKTQAYSFDIPDETLTITVT